MKSRILCWGIVLIVALLIACNTNVEREEKPCQELVGIDSLMWERPDSALKVMMEFTERGRADSLVGFDGHYCQLLISELLYKNHGKQDNRSDLQLAVDYFDNNDNAFLSARAHYMNGVGYYEQDSMVEACTEYLKALEIMETHFPNVETCHGASLQPKHLPRFMSLTYSRIGELLSCQFMQEPAIACFKEALAYEAIEPASPNNRSTLLLFIGKQYYKLNQCDSASYYFDEALHQLSDTNNAIFRDLVSFKALLDYDVHHHVEAPINDLKRMIAQAADENEMLARYTTLGAIYSVEGQYDSALFYLTPVFENKDDVVRQKAVSPYLRAIYENLGDTLKADQYAVFFANNERSEGENKAQVSKINELFQQHLQWKQDRAKEKERQIAVQRNRWLWAAIVTLLLLVAIAIIVARRGYGKRLRHQQEESNRQLEAARKALKAKEQDALWAKVNAIYQDKLGNKARRIFDAYNEVHPETIAKLKTTYPDLTDTEINICVLSYFRFRLKEMACILDLRENTVAKYRTSIKKKTQIETVEDLMERLNY